MRRALSSLILTAIGLSALAGCSADPQPRTSAERVTESAFDLIKPGPEDALFLGAGDIARRSQLGDAQATGDLIRALLAKFPDAKVFTAGDNAYEDGTVDDFQDAYHPAWGSFNKQTVPSPGNHDYHSTNATPYFNYFAYYAANPTAKAQGFYSFDLKDWHIVSLNSNLPMDASSPQVTWLKQDLESTDKRCILAFWHHPLFSSGRHGSQAHDPGRQTGDLWAVLESHNADLILNGHDHDYERFALQDRHGSPTPRGIREFVIGTGGAELRRRVSTKANSQFFDRRHHGILVLTLHPSSYEWMFLTTDRQSPDRSFEPVPCHEN